jgi:hypothetical protein
MASVSLKCMNPNETIKPKKSAILQIERVFIVLGIITFVLTSGWGNVPGNYETAIVVSLLVALFKYAGLLFAIAGLLVSLLKNTPGRKRLACTSLILLLFTSLCFYTNFRVKQITERGEYQHDFINTLLGK